MIDAALAFAQAHRQANLDTLSELLRIPSISTLPEHKPDLQAAAEWWAQHLRQLGMHTVEILPTPGAPVVYADWLGAAATAPTVLLYGHYDVQPVDPVEEWRTPPFTPTIIDDYIFARGASDDKGQTFMVLAAVDAYLRTAGALPVNFKMILEGEEEVSSPNMAAFVRQHRARLAADSVLICDSGMLDRHTPLIEYGVRGMCYVEIEVRGPAGDLHSGTFGGAVENPFNVLVRLLAACQDGVTRRVLIPGFYDRVRAADAEERALLAALPLSEADICELTGAAASAGEEGFSVAERIAVRPTFEIHGIPGGFTGAGKKTVLPAKATAKVSMRLVPDQDAHEIAHLLETHLRQLAPPTVALEVRLLGASRPAVIDFRAPAIQAAAQAYGESFGAAPRYTRSGGSLPIIPEFQDALAAPVALMGFGLPDDNIHAPNERFYLPNFDRGIAALIHYFSLLAAV